MPRLPALLLTALLLTPALAGAQPGSAPAVRAPAGDDALVTITLRDGQLLRGVIVVETDHHIIINLVSGGEMAVSQSQIRSIKRNDQTVFVSADLEIYKHDPNRTRYLYGPSAFMLRQGEGYFSQTELIASTIGYGVTDWLTIQVGSIVPFLLADDGTNFILGARVGTPLSETVHIAAGVHSLVIPDAGAIGIASGQVTFGTPRAHLTLSAGYPFLLDEDGDDEVGDVMISVSGNLRVSKHVAFVSENWIFPDLDNTVIGSFATRFMGEHSAVDVGLVFIEGAEVPIPWFDFTWNWD